MVMTVENLAFDAEDPRRLAAFWAEVIGHPVDEGASPYFATIGKRPNDLRPAWLFIKVPEAKTAKNRLHLDLRASDVPADLATLSRLGATKLGEYDEWGSQWVSFEDPEGNVFDVATPR
ncbi:MAG TPA: VOC family protein [Dermatophilaceae bacterium]|nr:VOC family protein [Dermatophilaceae bacterium]